MNKELRNIIEEEVEDSDYNFDNGIEDWMPEDLEEVVRYNNRLDYFINIKNNILYMMNIPEYKWYDLQRAVKLELRKFGIDPKAYHEINEILDVIYEKLNL